MKNNWGISMCSLYSLGIRQLTGPNSSSLGRWATGERVLMFISALVLSELGLGDGWGK